MNSENNISQPYSLLSNIRYIVMFLWRKDRSIFAFTFLQMIGEVLSPFIAILLPKYVIDALTNGTSLSELGSLIFGLTVIMALVNVIALVSETLTANYALLNRINFIILTEEKSMNLDYDLYESPEGQTARQKAYEALNNNDSGSEAIVKNLAKFSAHVVGLIVYSGLVASLNPLLMIFMIGCAFINGFFMRKAQLAEAASRNNIAENNKKLNVLTNQANDYQYAKDVRLYSLVPWLNHYTDQFIKASSILHKKNASKYLQADIIEAITSLIRDGVAYAYLINLVLAQEITIGNFTLLLSAVAGISSWISKLTTDYSLIVNASLEMGYFREYMSIQNYQPDQIIKAKISEAPSIEFENVSFKYPGSERWILHNFKLYIAPGEKLAVVGINGAGKTTCIKLLTGLYRPTEGRILIDGIDISQIEKDELFRLFAPLFQEIRIMAMDVERNVSLAPENQSNTSRVWESMERAGVAERIRESPNGLKTQLTRMLDSSGIELSGGQAQKLMLARALYKDAPIVIMDEPTAALDPIAEADLYQQYNDMVGGKTSIYISHRLSSTRFCDRIAFIADGQVSEVGTHETLMKEKGAYAAMYEIQAHYYQDNIEESENK